MDAAQPHRRGRGVDLLLAHCSALDSIDEELPSPPERLQAALGEELARLLLSALAGTQRRPLRV